MSTERYVDAADAALLVDLARQIVPQSWGLDTIVAVNPLSGLEHLPFEEAAQRARDLYDARCYPPRPPEGGRDTLRAADAHRAMPQRRSPATEFRRRGTAEVADTVDVMLAHFCAGHAAGGQIGGGLWDRWRDLAVHDRTLRRWSEGHAAERIRTLPEDAPAAVAWHLRELGIDEDHALGYLEAQLTRLAGWAAALSWQERRGATDLVIDFVAIRLTLEAILRDCPHVPAISAGGTRPSAIDELDETDLDAEALHQTETRFRTQLLQELHDPEPFRVPTYLQRHQVAPQAQAVFCIDVRSEGLRRHLEAIGPYETLGFAGFFGLPIAVLTAGSSEAVASCPVIVDPRATLVETEANSHRRPTVPRNHLHDHFHTAKHGAASGFALADASGWILGLTTLARSGVPGLYDRAAGALRRKIRPVAPTRFAVDPFAPDSGPGASVTDLAPSGLTVAEQAQLAFGALTAMGLTHRFAPVVLLCGHGSTNRNNPFRSSLDCGACGGNRGGPNARILAAMANRPPVREELARLGIDIPASTWFVAAEHDTTDDRVEILDRCDVPASHHGALADLVDALDRAGRANLAERGERLPGPPPRRWRPRSSDPALTVADWGLVRCAAIVVGPRSLSAGLDLDRRVFLHSYRSDADPEGLVLEAIMTGPVVVAHWISAQYYFSTVDPLRFGAGSKLLTNVVERVGVCEGVGADLRIGLPLESVYFDGKAVHEPLRLLAVIDAPAPTVESVIARNPVLQRLFNNGWATLVARPAHGPDGFVVRDRGGVWSPWEPPAELDAQQGRTEDSPATLVGTQLAVEPGGPS